MSLSCALLRSLNRSRLSIYPYRKFYIASSANIYVSPKLKAAEICETHMDKNERLKRPLSPHLSIYKFELPANMSIMHRTTGIILSVYAIALSAGIGGLIPIIDGWCLPPAIIFIGKYLISLPVTYHFYNGIRHLLWDLGKFLTMKEVYSTGYAVVGLSIISALILSCL